MMSTILLRRSSSAIANSSQRIAAALLSPIETLLSSPAIGNGVLPSSEFKLFSSISFSAPRRSEIKARAFHAKSGPLSFQASLISQAEYAVADYDEGSNNSSDDSGLEIVKLGIAPEIVSALAKRSIAKLFPIQRAVLEPAMQGRDMIGRARTGTGKTLAFGIPIMDKIIQFNAKHGRGRNPLALVLAPTRELARQVEKEFYESAPSLDTICLYGGTPISQQMRQLDMGVDVAVGTPGRIIDLLNRGSLNLSEVQFVVIDEADQMLQVGFQEDVERILERLPQNRQSMMFSATMPSWIRKLTQNYLKDPVTIDLVGDSDQKLADGISLFSIVTDMYAKGSIIGPLITEHAKGGKCIIFTQTKRDADRLAYSMARSFRCEALHGDISQRQRERTLSGFRDGKFNILVATDVAARGLDIPNVDLVIHYELPNNPEIFVHRSGRTGRAGKKGSAILIYTQEQMRAVRVIERDTGCKFTELPRINVEGATMNTFNDMGGNRFGSFGGFRDRRSADADFGRTGGRGGISFGRSGSYGNPGFGRSSGYGDSGQMGRPSSGQFGSFGGSGSGQSGSGFGGSSTNRAGNYGGFGNSRFGGFGESGSSNSPSGGFGDFGSGRSSGFGDNVSRQTGGAIGNSRNTSFFGESGSLNRSGGFGDFGSGRPNGFGDSFSSRTGGSTGDSNQSGFGSFGSDKIDNDRNSGRRPF